MTCTSFQQIHEGRNATDSVDDKGKTAISLVQVWRAETDSASDDATVVAAHASCPLLGTAHPNYAYARLKSRSFNNESFSKKIWLVTLTYSTGIYETNSNPLNTAARITWRSEQYQRAAVFDKDGVAITNSAGDPYDPAPERDDSRWQATVVKNMPMVPTWLLTYQDAINNAPFIIDGLTVQARKAKVQSVEIGDWQYSSSTAYRQLTLGIAIAKDGFQLDLVDQGFNKLVSGSGGYTREAILIDDEDGNKVQPTTPVLLDGAGGVVANPSPATAVKRTHYTYSELNFGLLPLV